MLNAHYPNLKKTFGFTREGLNRALSAKAGPCIGPNELSLFMAKFSTEYPFSNQRRFVSFYFWPANGKPPSDPKCAQDVTDTIAKTNQLQRGCIRLGRSTEDRDLAATGVEGDRAPAGTINHITPKRKVRTNDHDCFANEKTQLEFVCQSLGTEALITTKYHAEYAGEGIEYSWGAAKVVYRRYPLASKKGKEKFVDLVSKCTSRELLTTDLIRKFSRRARSYMLTYK